MGEDRAQRRESARREIASLAWLLDSSIPIPGTRFRFGLEPLIGLIPGVGDVASGAFGAYIVLRALVAGVPRIVVARMAANVALDVLIGAIPLLGDAFDFVYKSNTRNLRLFERYASAPDSSTRDSWLFFGIVLAVVVGIIVLALAIAIWLIGLLLGAL